MELLDKYIDESSALPPAPRILVQLLSLLREENPDAEQIVRLIMFDPVLTARVLQFTNSAAIGLADPIHDLSEAVMRVGFNEIYRLVAAAVAETTLGAAQRGYGLAAGELWEHSVVSAVSARVLARSVRLDENLAFTAGLLHDIGKLVLSSSLEDQYSILVAATEQSGQSLLEMECTLLGVDHASVGGRLMQRWSFPEKLILAVWHHHDPAASADSQELPACVHIGDVAAHALGYGHGHQAHALRVHADALQMLQLSPVDFEKALVQTEAALSVVHWFKRRETD